MKKRGRKWCLRIELLLYNANKPLEKCKNKKTRNYVVLLTNSTKYLKNASFFNENIFGITSQTNVWRCLIFFGNPAPLRRRESSGMSRGWDSGFLLHLRMCDSKVITIWLPMPQKGHKQTIVDWWKWCLIYAHVLFFAIPTSPLQFSILKQCFPNCALLHINVCSLPPHCTYIKHDFLETLNKKQTSMYFLTCEWCIF